MKILSIETSCDETAVCVLEGIGNAKNPKFKILGNALFSQAKLHQEFGGVFPTLAKREHQRNLPRLLAKALKEAKLSSETPKIDLIAVTEGPGLEPALWVGIVFAKDLSDKWNVPVVGINHMEGHILSPFLDNAKIGKIKYPTLSLLVSGGHTELVLIKKFLNYEILGKTRDDAVGEAFDKVARILGLPYPGGPEISKLAALARKKKVNYDFVLPRPMIYSKDLDFSFSGLKTAVLYLTRKIGNLSEQDKKNIALEFENSAIDVLESKTKSAIQKYNIKTLIVAGGVSANTELRKRFKKLTKEEGANLYLPDKKLTTDNAVMIAIAGFFKKDKKNPAKNIKAQGNLEL